MTPPVTTLPRTIHRRDALEPLLALDDPALEILLSHNSSREAAPTLARATAGRECSRARQRQRCLSLSKALTSAPAVSSASFS